MEEETKRPFTAQEQEIMDLIVKSHNLFVKLERQHPNEITEWVKCIHDLQNILGWRILRRDYPNDFKCCIPDTIDCKSKSGIVLVESKRRRMTTPEEMEEVLRKANNMSK